MRSIILLLFIPISTGVFIEDPANDVYDSQGLGIQGQDDYLDILSLDVNETSEGSLTFTLRLADKAPDATSVFPEFIIFLDISKRSLEFRYDGTCNDIAAFQNGNLLACIPFHEDPLPSWTASRELLGHPAYGMDAKISVQTESLFLPGLIGSANATHFTDKAPDEGTESLVISYQNHIQTPELSLQSKQPVQFSNGAQKWFIFHVDSQVHEEVELAYSAPEGVVFAGPNELVPGTKSFPVLARVESQHIHGEQTRLEISQGGQALQLGIEFEAFPNPSGHHQTLHFHSSAQPSSVDTQLGEDLPIWMNALEEDLFIDATDEPVPGKWGSTGLDPLPVTTVEWMFPLSPEPRLPLHFQNDSAELVLEFDVEQDTPMTFYTNLRHCPGGFQTRGCVGESQGLYYDSFTYEAQAGRNLVEAELPSLIGEKRVVGGTIFLQIQARASIASAMPVGVAPIMMVTGSSLTLPLAEVEAPVFNSTLPFQLPRLEGNPGDAILLGSAEYSYIVLEGDFETRGNTLVVPNDTELGNSDAVVGVISNDGRFFVGNTTVTVVDEEERPIVSAEEKQSPTIPIVFTLGVLAALAFRRK